MREVSFKGENLSERARKNLFILDAIRRRGPISKTDISSLIGLNVVTVSNYVDDFLRQKLVFEKEFDVSKGGRRPLLLDLNPSTGYTLGVGINLTGAIGLIADLSGKVCYRVKRDKPSEDVNDVVDAIIGVVRELLAQAKAEGFLIRGIGLGIGGVVDEGGEKVRWPQRIGNTYQYVNVTVPLKDILEREFHYPVMIENDATVACFGEQWLALESNVKDLVYMFSGVGCGLMINQEIYRGTSGCAGEVAIHSATKEAPYFLGRWEADLGIREEYLRLKKLQDNKAVESTSEAVSLDVIFRKVKENDPIAVSVVREAGKRLGMRIAYLINLLNPRMVVIGGGIEEAGIPFFEEVKATVSQWCFEEASNVVKIVPSRLGEEAVALGASSLIARYVFATVND